MLNRPELIPEDCTKAVEILVNRMLIYSANIRLLQHGKSFFCRNNELHKIFRLEI